MGISVPVDAMRAVLDAAEARLESLRQDQVEGWREDPAEPDSLERAITEVEGWLSSVPRLTSLGD